MDFQQYIENRLVENISPEGKEAMREIQIVINQSLSQIPKINGFGINDLKFDLITEERATQGLQMNLEAKGSAVAKNKEHINGMLQKLMATAREPLWQKKIFLEIMYHNIDVQENMHENNTAIGLKGTLYFNTIAAAIIFI
jgi:hypothetical protein